MKIIMKAGLVATAILAGCAHNSGIVPMGKDSYFVSRQAATGFTGTGNLKAEALVEANQYCESKKKSLQVVHAEEARPPFIFGNFPKVELQFMCLENDDPAFARPMLRKDADTIIQIQKN